MKKLLLGSLIGSLVPVSMVISCGNGDDKSFIENKEDVILKADNLNSLYRMLKTGVGEEGNNDYFRGSSNHGFFWGSVAERQEKLAQKGYPEDFKVEFDCGSIKKEFTIAKGTQVGDALKNVYAIADSIISSQGADEEYQKSIKGFDFFRDDVYIPNASFSAYLCRADSSFKGIKLLKEEDEYIINALFNDDAIFKINFDFDNGFSNPTVIQEPNSTSEWNKISVQKLTKSDMNDPEGTLSTVATSLYMLMKRWIQLEFNGKTIKYTKIELLNKLNELEERVVEKVETHPYKIVNKEKFNDTEFDNFFKDFLFAK